MQRPSIAENSRRWMFRAAFWILSVCGSTGLAAATEGGVFFTFLECGESGGVAKAWVDAEGVLRVERLETDSAKTLISPFKLARSGNFLAISAGADREPEIVSFDLQNGGTGRRTPLPAEVSDLAPAPEGFVVAMSKGRFARVDAVSGSIVAACDARKALDPPGRKGEFLLPLPDENRLLASFQKDDENSAALGNRVVVFELESLKPIADLSLPRDRNDLHLPPKETGPGPEALAAFPGSNTLAISLDLYGAVAWTDLDTALGGKLENHTTVSSAPDGAWGTAFPDRFTPLNIAGRDLLLVGNAGKGAGLALFDVKKREKIGAFPTASGTDPAVVFPEKNLAVTVSSGKIKARGTDGLDKTSQPGTDLYILDLTPLNENSPPEFKAIPLKVPTLRIAPLDKDSVLVFSESEVLQVSIPAGKILQRANAPGKVVRAWEG